MTTTRRTRDPQARRDALAQAVIETIAEAGIGRTTHRAVAAKAGLPLGATTYYFPKLEDLIAAGLRLAQDDTDRDLREWHDRLAVADDPAVAIAELAAAYLADRRRARIEYELCVAAARDEALRPLAEAWLDGMHDLLAPLVGSAAARAVCAYLDGVMLQALVTGRELDRAAVASAFRRLTAA